MNATFVRLACLALAILGTGCAVGASPQERVTGDEIAALPRGCGNVLALGADVLAIGTIDGSDDLVLDTTDGRCLETAPSLVDTLRTFQDDSQSEALIRVLLREGVISADPSPHPDVVAADPSPHPDRTTTNVTTGGTSADPSPHPDRAAESGDGSVLIIIWIIVEDGSPDGDGSEPATPTPPKPRTSDSTSP